MGKQQLGPDEEERLTALAEALAEGIARRHRSVQCRRRRDPGDEGDVPTGTPQARLENDT
jgi:hypothetical protein